MRDCRPDNHSQLGAHQLVEKLKAKITLVPKAGKVLRHSSNLRMIEICVALLVLDQIAALVPYFADVLPFDQRWLIAISTLAGSAAWICRFIPQRKISGSDETTGGLSDGK